MRRRRTKPLQVLQSSTQQLDLAVVACVLFMAALQFNAIAV